MALDSLVSNFFWSNSDGSGKIHWAAWKNYRNLKTREVGTGHYIDVFKDPWVPAAKQFRIPVNNDISVNQDMVVADLVQERSWNLQPINRKIDKLYLDLISKIPLTSSPRADKLMWAPARDGTYSVKAGYRAKTSAIEGRTGVTRASPSKKVDTRIWRRCASNPVCPVCGDETESLEHLFLLCNWVKVAWFGYSMGIYISPRNIKNLGFWLEEFQLLNDSDFDYSKAYVASMLWAIWKLRCRMTFEQVEPSPSEAMEMTNRAMKEYWEVNSLFPKAPTFAEPEASYKWRKLQSHTLKLNCDDAFCKKNGKGGIGIVCRDSEGLFIKGWAEQVSAYSAFHTEMLAICKAVQLVEEWGMQSVIIEMDCQDLYKAVTQCSFRHCPWSLHGLLIEITDPVQNRSLVSFSLIPREGNSTADRLAALA
ncbi:uncharacterized protein LOC114735028 [Neltuma alba]|uniref:uncharacterized protein LOC114735028 n=1 Tax=Neltuma alba TaxID=207710 RepID=UPI0010A41C95|nr:uncharacterized protein LOC114735028 [Prosopis alba]